MRVRVLVSIAVLSAWPVSSQEDFVGKVYAAYSASVIAIETRGELYNGEIEIASGSGFLVSRHGYALTAAHVLLNASDNYKRISITGRIETRDSPAIQASIVDIDRVSDLALIKMKTDRGGGYCYTGSAPRVGQPIAVLGFPLNYELFVDTGRVKGRKHKDQPVWVTDAPLNPGNSGGPVFNQDGYLAGIVSGGAVEFVRADNTRVAIEGIKFFRQSYDEPFFRRPKVFEALKDGLEGPCQPDLAQASSKIRLTYSFGTKEEEHSIEKRLVAYVHPVSPLSGFRITKADLQIHSSVNVASVDVRISDLGQRAEVRITFVQTIRGGRRVLNEVHGSLLTEQAKL